jgi:hypothetical protein
MGDLLSFLRARKSQAALRHIPPSQRETPAMALSAVLIAVAEGEDLDTASALATLINADEYVRDIMTGTRQWTPDDVIRFGAHVRDYFKGPASRVRGAGNASASGEHGEAEGQSSWARLSDARAKLKEAGYGD